VVIAGRRISTGVSGGCFGPGACAVVVGTRLIATTESGASDAYKRAVISSKPEDIVCSDRISGNPATWISRSIEGFERMPDVADKRWRDFWSAGQSVAQVEEIKPAGEVIREMVEEYETACRKLEKTLSARQL
jgi:nitronate monooxygenase